MLSPVFNSLFCFINGIFRHFSCVSEQLNLLSTLLSMVFTSVFSWITLHVWSICPLQIYRSTICRSDQKGRTTENNNKDTYLNYKRLKGKKIFGQSLKISSTEVRCMALYPRQNSSCCMQHCCFKLLVVFTIQYLSAIIQHCALTIQHSYFKMQYSSCCMQHCCFKLLVVFSIQYLSAIIQHCALTIQHSYFKMQYSTSIIPHFALTI